MSYLINNQQKLNEIIFAKRNKSYGAYIIRSTYGNTVAKSLLLMLTGLCTVMSVAWFLSNRNDNSMNNYGGQVLTEKVYVVKVDMDKPKELKTNTTKREPPKPNNSSSGSTASTHVIDSLQTTETNTVLNQDVAANTGSAVSQGDPGPSTVTTSGGGTGDKPDDSGKGGIKNIIEVDANPEFNGGLGALYKFVASHLKYPPIAIEDGREGTVYVKFVVDEKGKVGNLTLLNNAGYGFDEEAFRVVSMIPDFKTPAKIRGEAVKVYYQLPIKFRLR
jgi:protein TonB